MSPIVSVVITAHNRKKYLVNAVKSVLNQDSSRNDYEIIVVKNYTDEDIDSFLEKEGVKCIYTDDQPFGMKLAIGIENSSGDVISFLDDDDEFSKNKISRLIEVFDDRRVVYHHSSISAIDESSNEHTNGLSKNIPRTIIKEDFKSSDFELVMKYKLDWYMSAISCRASLLKNNSTFIKKVPASLDKITFLVCIESGGCLYFDSSPLTRYRVHESLTTRITDRDSFLQARKDFYLRSLRSLVDASDYFNNKTSRYLLNCEIIHGRLLTFFFSDEPEHNLSAYYIIKYAFFSLFKRLNAITYWSLLDIFRIIVPEKARSSFYKRSIRKLNFFISE
jgi:glycosyltransferase involved in cell wall biosynthesis